MIRATPLLFIFLALASVARSQDAAIPASAGQQWVSVVEKARSAIVTIETQAGFGTGFLIQKNGTLVTNYHVIEDARQITVTLESGEVYKSAYVLRTDEEKDIAVLRIEGADLPFLRLGNSESMKVGEEVMAIGTPEGLEQTASTGIVSGRRMVPPGYQLIQTTAPISHGSSGGPLLNRNGECIGVIAAFLADGQNLNFAIPINYVRGIMDSLALSSNTTPRLISGTAITAVNSAPPIKPKPENVPSAAPTAAPSTGVNNPPPPSNPSTVSNPSRVFIEELGGLNGVASLRIDRAVWRKGTATQGPAFRQEYELLKGDLHLSVIPERIQVPLETMSSIVVANAKKQVRDAKITSQGFRSINGMRMLWLHMDATVNKIPITYYVHVYSGPIGTIQFFGYAARNLMPNYRSVVEELVSGFEISFPPSAVTPKPDASLVPSPALPPPSAADRPIATGSIYFYRESSSFDSMINPTVQCDGIELARLEKGQYFKVLLPVGAHACGLNGSTASKEMIILEVIGNGEYFAKYGGVSSKRLEIVDRTAFSKVSKNLKPIELGAIKSPTVTAPR